VQQVSNTIEEQKSDWRIVKVHAMYHYVDDIKRAGNTSEYSADMWESLHKHIMKNPYRGSNKKNVVSQILNHHVQQWNLTTIAQTLASNVEDEDSEVF